MDRIQRARTRRQQQTELERVLWFRLRDRRLRGMKFRRQGPAERCTVDFPCPEAHLIIEVGGGQQAVRDEAERTRILESMGYLVPRFWADGVLSNSEGVLEQILDTLDCREPPHPSPLLNEERERTE